MSLVKNLYKQSSSSNQRNGIKSGDLANTAYDFPPPYTNKFEGAENKIDCHGKQIIKHSYVQNWE